jgi:hypothetical protein
VDGGSGPVDYGIRHAAGRIRPWAGSERAVSKVTPLVGMIVSGLIGILFLADLAAGIPFRRVSFGLDIAFVVASLILAYLSWTLLEKARG